MMKFTHELILYDLTPPSIKSNTLLGLLPIENKLNIKEQLYNEIKHYMTDFFKENYDVEPIFNLYIRRTKESFPIRQYIKSLYTNDSSEIFLDKIQMFYLSDMYFVSMVGVIEQDFCGDCIDISIYVIIKDKNRS